MTKPKFTIDDYELKTDYEKPGYTYRLDTRGNTYEDLVADAWIFAVDKDGLEEWGEPLSEMEGLRLWDDAVEVIKDICKGGHFIIPNDAFDRIVKDLEEE
jgi:hypothetical protein